MAGTEPSFPFIKRLAGPFREFGFAAGLIYAMDRVLSRLSPHVGIKFYELMAQPVPPLPLLPVGLSRKLVSALIPPGHPDIGRMPARLEIKRQRFERGARCLGIYRKDELLGYVWFRSGGYDEDEVRCTYMLDSGDLDVFDFDLYVMPEHRMGLAFSSVWHGAFEHLRQEGVAYSFSRMTRFNTASRKAHQRLGAVRLGRALFLCVGSVQFMVSSLRPWLGLTWGDRRVMLRIPQPAHSPGAAGACANSKIGVSP
jgi:hypothetical protein